LEAWELEKWHSERQQDLLQKEAKFKFNKQQVRDLMMRMTRCGGGHDKYRCREVQLHVSRTCMCMFGPWHL
jgi:hypothetical protein